MATKKKVVVQGNTSEYPVCKDPFIIQNAPYWARYYAMDADGSEYYYEKAPRKESTSWQTGSLDKSEQIERSEGIGWEDSLQVLPPNNVRRIVDGEITPTVSDVESLVSYIKLLTKKYGDM